jgi:hypothetical protein
VPVSAPRPLQLRAAVEGCGLFLHARRRAATHFEVVVAYVLRQSMASELALDMFQVQSHTFRGDDGGDVQRDAPYNETIRRLQSEDYSEHMGAMGVMNPGLFAFLRSFTLNGAYIRAARRGAADARNIMRSFVLNFMIGWLVRLFDQRIFVFSHVVLSLMALRCRVPKMFWGVLAANRILYSYDTALMFATDMGNLVMHAPPPEARLRTRTSRRLVITGLARLHRRAELF